MQVCAWSRFCVTAARARGSVRAGSMRVTQEAAWVVMNCIDFRAAAECLFRGDVIRTEKLYKIAAVLTIKIKKYLCTHCYRSLLTPPHGCAAASLKKNKKTLKVWESLIVKPITPHNTWSLISAGMKELKDVYPPFTINLYHYNHFFFFSLSLCAFTGNVRLQRRFFFYSAFFFLKGSV